ncbi:hypothetical protein G6W51_16985 [Streptomyces coelicolor]|nr:hypothetical protein [Streptomyces coelicolor]
MNARQLIDTATHLLDNRQGMPNTPEPRLREADVRASLAQADALDRIAHALTRLADDTTTPAVHPAA